jgi:hypothetical protein
MGIPVHFCLTETSEAALLIANLVQAAQQGEGVYCGRNTLSELRQLVVSGVPLRWTVVPDGSLVAGLVSRVDYCGDLTLEPNMRAFPGGIPQRAQTSICANPKRPHSCEEIWRMPAPPGQMVAYIGVDSRASSWPEKTCKHVPDRFQLPMAELLHRLAKTRRSSPDSDTALARLAHHPFFGFWVQVLLLEALDRELGEESLILAPMMSTIVEDIEGSTRVFYRPRLRSTEVIIHRDTREIGSLDRVMNDLAFNTGLGRVYLPFGCAEGPWSLGLRLMRSVGLIQGRHDRWTLMDHILDRLHTSGMMTGVIRKGQTLREHLHSTLESLWNQRQHEMEKIYA